MYMSGRLDKIASRPNICPGAGLTCTEALGEDEELEVLEELLGVAEVTLDVEGDHGAGAVLLPETIKAIAHNTKG
jgi:hypothetical protein